MTVLTLLIVGGMYGVPALNRWMGEYLEGYVPAGCRKPVDSYEQARKSSEAVRIPLLLGVAFEPGDESVTDQDIMNAYAEKRRLAGEAAGIALAKRDCFDAALVTQASRVESSPDTLAFVGMPSATGCSDGASSQSIGKSGACSHHGGVNWGSPWATMYLDSGAISAQQQQMPTMLIPAG
ncbi:hypothetical protein ACFYWN_15800 [Streptomyces sp. NPDC002917]|uniref:hypothetical protein n=1 Tax=Streptomyces sp. NPDC002917 TaxID=3364671 RepID=UPI0036AA66C3